jgi:hypothetical protein
MAETEINAGDGEVSVGSDPTGAGDVAAGTLRGALGAMAMTGLRTLTVNAGIVEQPPPQAIVRQWLPGMRGPRVRGRGRRRATEELLHWSYGAGGGAVFAALPAGLRRQTWAGPVYGLLIWLSFEIGIAPLLGLKQARQVRPAERAALAADHLLYGFVVSGPRRRGR